MSQNRPKFAIYFFIDDATTSTEVENEEGFYRDIGGEDELGTTEGQPHNVIWFFYISMPPLIIILRFTCSCDNSSTLRFRNFLLNSDFLNCFWGSSSLVGTKCIMS